MLWIVTGRSHDPAVVTAIDGYEPAVSWLCPDGSDLPEPDPDAEIVTDQYRGDDHVVRTVWRLRAVPEGPKTGASALHRRPHVCEPVGSSEIGRILSRPHTTVQTWWARTRRGELPVPMPDPIGTVSGRPAWCRAAVRAWARQTGRLVDGISEDPSW
jgi:hypothetical protein